MKKRSVALLVVIATIAMMLAYAYMTNRSKEQNEVAQVQKPTYHFTQEGDNQAETYNFLTDNGFSCIQACVIMAEIKSESNFKSTATAFNEWGYGLMMWADYRKENLETFANSRGKTIDDYETQLLFILEELNTESEYYAVISHKGYSWTDFMEAKTLRDAVEAFSMVYSPLEMPSIEIKADFAEEFYNMYT